MLSRDAAKAAAMYKPSMATTMSSWMRAFGLLGSKRTQRFLSNWRAVAAALFLAGLCVAALLAPVLFPGDPLDMVAQPFLWPFQDAAYPLGTDSLGRDVLAGLVHGARVSLFVGFASTLLGIGVGIVVGAVAGYAGGWWDTVLMRLVEFFQTIPAFVLLVVVIAIAQPSIAIITFAIALVRWPTVARLVRAEFRALRRSDFVMAARGLGFGHARIIFREILPNTLPSVIVTGSVLVATAILNESALSFLGMGDPNVVSWGSMIGSGREALRTAWHLVATPGIAIVLTVLSLNILGDVFNDIANPRNSAS